jgi:hypothetical protein
MDESVDISMNNKPFDAFCSRCSRNTGNEIMFCPDRSINCCPVQIENVKYGDLASNVLLLIILFLAGGTLAYLSEDRDAIFLAAFISIIPIFNITDALLHKSVRLHSDNSLLRISGTRLVWKKQPDAYYLPVEKVLTINFASTSSTNPTNVKTGIDLDGKYDKVYKQNKAMRLIRFSLVRLMAINYLYVISVETYISQGKEPFKEFREEFFVKQQKNNRTDLPISKLEQCILQASENQVSIKMLIDKMYPEELLKVSKISPTTYFAGMSSSDIVIHYEQQLLTDLYYHQNRFYQDMNKQIAMEIHSLEHTYDNYHYSAYD